MSDDNDEIMLFNLPFVPDPQDWHRRSQRYLLSPKWDQVRSITLALDRYECQANLPGCEGIATQVHHPTYDRYFGRERIGIDTKSVCGRCHMWLSKHRVRWPANDNQEAFKPSLRYADIIDEATNDNEEPARLRAVGDND